MIKSLKIFKAGVSLKASVIIKRILLVFATVLIVTAGFLYGVIMLIHYGPSEIARNTFVLSALESSAGGFLAEWFLPKETIEQIVAQNTVKEIDEITDTSLIAVPNEDDADLDKIEIIDIKGKTYKGKLMIVHDPSRVEVGISGPFGGEYEGKKVQEMVKQAGAIAGINGGAFADPGGVGLGGTPSGIVIHNSEMLWGSSSEIYSVIGFDKNNKFIVGMMSGQRAMDMGIRDALMFGPILVINGKANTSAGTGGGLNPRTAIGQRSDGAVLLLVIDGRQVNSLGASFQDITDIMIEYGAVNAANLDGGMSSHMVYKNEIITNCSSLYGTRDIPTCFIVK